MQSNSIYITNDRVQIDTLPDDIQNVIFKKGLVTYGGKKVCFSGLIQTTQSIHVFLPRQMTTRTQYLPVFFAALRKYSATSKNTLMSEDEGNNLLGKDKLSLVTEILSDYQKNGVYSRRRRFVKHNNGKPNWSKTVSKFQPYLSPNGPIYLDYIGSSSDNRCDSEASKIHAYLVKHLDIKFSSVLFGFKTYQDDGLPSPQQLSKNYFLSVLSSELQNLYSDRDIQLFRHLIQYVKNEYGTAPSDLVIGLKGFHVVWEHMLKSTITGAVDINKRFSIPVYTDEYGNELVAANKGQRTDLIVHCKVNDVYAVVDAKYYDASDLNSAPGWSDLLKQFFYAKAVKSLQPNANIKNYFIFPGEQSVLKSAHMKNRFNNRRDEQYADIFCIYLDPLVVIKSYVEGSFLADLSKQLVE